MKSRNKKITYKCFYMTHSDKEMIDYLSKKFGINPSAVIRRLLTETFSILKYKEREEKK